jgi:hypothetical protein
MNQVLGGDGWEKTTARETNSMVATPAILIGVVEQKVVTMQKNNRMRVVPGLENASRIHVGIMADRPVNESTALVARLTARPSGDLPPWMEPVSITRVALPRDRPCPLAEA